MSFPLGQPVRLTFNTYSDPAETTLADPNTVSLDILLPTVPATTTTVTWAGGQIIRDSLGKFHYDYQPATGGHYPFHWTATGTVTTSQDGSFDVDPEYGATIVSTNDFAIYMHNSDFDAPRAALILRLAQSLCESIIKPLPSGAEAVVLDVAERAYTVPPEGVGPFATVAPATFGSGGLFLTQENKATLRRLAGGGGAFMIDTMPATAGQDLPWWDTGNIWVNP